MTLDIDPETHIEKTTGLYIEPPGIGVSWLWLGRTDHIFYWAAVKHDMRYTQRAAGISQGPLFETSRYSDKQFRDDCIKIVDARIKAAPFSDIPALEEVKIIDVPGFYWTIRGVGKARWPKIETDPKKRSVRVQEYIELLQMLDKAGVM